MRAKPIVILGITLTVIGWIALMVSFWLPDPIGVALQATALSLLVPGFIAGTGAFIFYQEIEEYRPTKKPRVLRCNDCQTKILNPAGTTIGDQIEGEFMLDDPVHRRKY